MQSTYECVSTITSFGFNRRWRRQLTDMMGLRRGLQVSDLMTGSGETWMYVLPKIGDSGTLTALACKRGVTVVDITSTRMLMAHGFLRRLFEVFERFKTPVDVVTTSEVSVSVTVDNTRRLDDIKICLTRDLQFRDCEEIGRRSCRRDKLLMPPVRGG